MKKKFTYCKTSLLIIVLNCLAVFQGYSQACTAINVSGITSTSADCPSSGSITVTATGTGLVYRLISGPSGYSTASNGTGAFNTLTAGSYIVEIADACGNKTTRNIAVVNAYPAFSVSSVANSNVCTNGTQGGTINVSVTGGKPPYQYDAVLAGSSPSYGSATGSTSFNKGVTSFGTYRIYVKDACGEVRTYDILLQPLQQTPLHMWWEDLALDRPCGETIGGLPTITWKLHLTDQNGMAVGFNNMIGSTYQVYRPVTANSITSSSENCSTALGTLVSSGTVTAANIPAGDTVTYPVTIPQEDVILIFTSKCGQTFKYCYNFNNGAALTPDADYNFIQQSCSAAWNNQVINLYSKYVYNMTPPYTFVLTKSNAATVTNNDGYFYNLSPVNFPLSVRVTDACGRTLLKNFTMPVQGSGLQFTAGPEWSLTCTTAKNTASAEIRITGGDLQGMADATNIVITGGTVTAVPAISSYNDWIPGYIASNLLAGYTYKILITNLCGEKDSVTFTVPNDQWGQSILNWNLAANVNALCGQNKSTITANAGYTGYNPLYYYLYNNTSPNTVIDNNSTGIFQNVPPGNYKVKFVVPSPAWACPGKDVKDSVNITVLADGAGQTITRKTITTCEVNGVPTLAGKAIIEVSGSGPFTYEIIKNSLVGTGGEVWTTSSTNNPSNTYTWDIPLSGDPSNTVYSLRTTDKCGNKVTTQASLQPINPPLIQAQNNPCIGNADYSLTLNPYGGNFTYRWVKLPDISTTLSTSNTLTFPGAYTAANDGIYRCYADLSGCVQRSVAVTISSINCNAPLPVKLVLFNGSFTDDKAQLEWIAENELNFKQYEVEKSNDGINFIKLNTVPAKSGLTSVNNYSYSDDLSNFNLPAVYYRLKIVDKDGKYVYSAIVRINVNSVKKGISIFPNPARQTISVSFNSNVTSAALIKVIDKTGSVLISQTIQALKGYNTVKIGELDKLPPGAFVLEVQTTAGVETARFMKL